MDWETAKQYRDDYVREKIESGVNPDSLRKNGFYVSSTISNQGQTGIKLSKGCWGSLSTRTMSREALVKESLHAMTQHVCSTNTAATPDYLPNEAKQLCLCLFVFAPSGADCNP